MGGFFFTTNQRYIISLSIFRFKTFANETSFIKWYINWPFFLLFLLRGFFFKKIVSLVSIGDSKSGKNLNYAFLCFNLVTVSPSIIIFNFNQLGRTFYGILLWKNDLKCITKQKIMKLHSAHCALHTYTINYIIYTTLFFT